MSAPITVVAAVIEQSGLILICQRRRGDPFELKWEFPGGKVKPGETPQEALARELNEELQVSATIGPELFRTRHCYAEMGSEIELVFFAATLGLETMMNRAFERVVWAERARLPTYDFLPADRELVQRLSKAKAQIHDSTAKPQDENP
ncbi:MAG TPA: (deoxy)nucleoside triphosphate pyrophosphohydrolase [Candidatus Acidoferrales bacterium]|nr:(deoxy)nucleoside triphosphate pyrophosphohydrolase [Candidatus Acidoferrales bacterium]